MGDQRTLTWTETDPNLVLLSNYGYHFNIAFNVATGGQVTPSNIIWKSNAGAPVVDITWTEKYALNWTASEITPGVSVTFGGRWQPCDKGDAFSIDKYGTFNIATPRAGEEDWLQITDVQYYAENGIHILVGIQREGSTTDYDIIYADPTPLWLNAWAKYQPQEQCTWWLSTDIASGVVYSQAGIKGVTKDFTDAAASTGQFHWYTSCDVKKGKWYISEKPIVLPASAASAKKPKIDKPQEITPAATSWEVTLPAALEADAQTKAETALVKALEENFLGPKVTFEGTKVTIKFDSRAPDSDADEGSLDHLFGTDSGDKVNDALKAIRSFLAADAGDLVASPVEDAPADAAPAAPAA